MYLLLERLSILVDVEDYLDTIRDITEDHILDK